MLSACATTSVQAPSVVDSGFLSDYSLLQKGGEDEALFVYRNPDADYTRYDKILLERVTLWREGDGSLDEIPEIDLRLLAGTLYTAVRVRLEEDFEITKEPGPGVMRVHLALTEVQSSNVALDVFSTLAPPARTLSEAQGLAVGTQSFVGAASIEGEITDTETGEILVAAIDRRMGRRSLKGAFDEWSDVKASFEFWAERLGSRLAEAKHSGKLGPIKP